VWRISGRACEQDGKSGGGPQARIVRLSGHTQHIGEVTGLYHPAVCTFAGTAVARRRHAPFDAIARAEWKDLPHATAHTSHRLTPPGEKTFRVQPTRGRHAGASSPFSPPASPLSTRAPQTPARDHRYFRLRRGRVCPQGRE